MKSKIDSTFFKTWLDKQENNDLEAISSLSWNFKGLKEEKQSEKTNNLHSPSSCNLLI